MRTLLPEEVGGKGNMADVVHCHVSADAVFSQLVGHDSSSRVQDQDVEVVVLGGDLFGGIGGGKLVAKVVFHEGDFARTVP
jgi:hypothetical protein